MPDDIRKQPWLVEIAIEPKSKADWEKLGAALAKLVADDPSFSVWSDAESAQIILRGTDELQLINKIDTLKRTYKIDAKIGAPQVAYREKITRQATVDYTHKKKQNGNRGQFARIKIVAQPDELNSGFTFENAIISGSVPKDFIPAIEKGLEGQMASGAIAGFPVLNVQVSLVDGASHDVDSSAMSFEIAARAAMREALQKGGSVLLEPIIKVEVETPPPYTELVIGDLNSRRGQIQGQDTRGSANVISAMVPFANMFFYVHDLRSISQGRATFTIRFDHYAAVPLPPDDDPPFRPAIGMRP